MLHNSAVGQTLLSALRGRSFTHFAMTYHSPRAPTSKPKRHLPHWTQKGVIYWVTFRLADSLPQDKLIPWRTERQRGLLHHPDVGEEL